MEVLPLSEGWQVVLDVGHTAAVTAIDAYDDVVITGGLDGYVCVRGRDGRSRIPPAHLPEVRCLAVLPGTDLVVVGTEGMVYGLDLESGRSASIGGFEGMGAVAAVGLADRVVLGGEDGSIRTIDLGDPPRTIARFGAPVQGLVAAGDAVVATFTDGRVRVLDLDGEVRAETSLEPGEVLSVAADAEVVVLGGAGLPGSAPLSGQLLVLDAALTERARLPQEVYVEAVALTGGAILALLGDGRLVRTDPSLAEPTTLAQREGLGSASLRVLGDEVWTGGIDGSVGRWDPPLELPSIPSRVLAASMTTDQRFAATTDGLQVALWDLRSGEALVTLALEGVRAVSFAEDDTLDVVVAFLDGRLERRTAPQWTEVVADTRLPARPDELGYVGPFVIVQGPGIDEVRMLDAETLAPFEPNQDALDDRCVLERRGFPFVGRGLLEGVELSVLEGRELVVQRPGLLTATSGATDAVRIWDGTRFVR